MQLVERDARSRGSRQRRFAKFALAEFDDVPRARFVGHLKLVARFGRALQAEHFDRRRGPRAFHRAAMIVKHRANFAVDRAANENIAGIQRSGLHQNRRHRAAAPVHAGFQHGARAGRFRIGFQFAQVGNEQKHFQQLVQILFLFRGDFHHHGVAAPFLGHQAAIGKLALDAFGLRARLVDFIDGHDDGHARGFGVVDGFLRLRHHAVIGRDDQHNDVRDFRAARAHAREGFVARRVDEHDFAPIDVNFRRADVLRDSAGFSRGHFGFADRVEQAGFAVIDVAHHGHDGRARHKIFRLLFQGDFRTTSSSNVMTLTMPLNASARLVAVGVSSAWLMLAKIPRSSKIFRTSLARTSSFSARSRTVTPSVIVISRGSRGGGAGARSICALRRCSPTPMRARTGCSLRSPSSKRFSIVGRARAAGLRS